VPTLRYDCIKKNKKTILYKSAIITIKNRIYQ